MMALLCTHHANNAIEGGRGQGEGRQAGCSSERASERMSEGALTNYSPPDSYPSLRYPPLTLLPVCNL